MLRAFDKYKLVYAHLWGLYGQSGWVRLSYLLHVASRVCKLIALPVAISLIITHLSKQNYDDAKNAVLFFVVVSLVIGLITPLVKYLGILGENKVYRKSTAGYFAQLVSTDIDYFNSNLSGYLTTATRQYADSSLVLVRAMRDKYLTTILSIVFPLLVIMYLDWWLGLVTLALTFVQAGYLLWGSSAITPYRTESRELYKVNSGRMADIVSNILAVKSSAQEGVYVDKVRRGAEDESISFTKRYIIQAKIIAIREVMTVVFFMVLLWLTVQRMSGGFIDITAAVLVVTYTTTILAGVYALSDDLDQHDDLIDKIIPAFEILNRKNLIQDSLTPVEISQVNGDIKLQNVSFHYDKDEQVVFNNFSMHIPKGQKVGVVGVSGAGKSTLTKLLLRFNDVNAGEILIDDIDIKNIKQSELRSNIAYVPQEPLLFHASIRENVLLSKPDSSDEDVARALKSAHALKFVEALPNGLDSIVGERGVKLSGGQKQRIAIARAVLRQSPIIILDEATSALDSESEHIIKDSFKDILKGKTAIVVAHRLSTLSDMDRIVVIDKGKIVEDGMHDELLAHKGAYARLWNRQQKHIEDA